MTFLTERERLPPPSPGLSRPSNQENFIQDSVKGNKIIQGFPLLKITSGNSIIKVLRKLFGF